MEVNKIPHPGQEIRKNSPLKLMSMHNVILRPKGELKGERNSETLFERINERSLP